MRVGLVNTKIYKVFVFTNLKISGNFDVQIRRIQFIMAKKGREKNTKNKAKHSRLVTQKKNKKKAEEALRKERLRAIVKGTQEKPDTD